MFDFSNFYNGLSRRTDYFDNYWDKFPTGHLMRFKSETLSLLKKDIYNKDSEGLSNTIAVICWDEQIVIIHRCYYPY